LKLLASFRRCSAEIVALAKRMNNEGVCPFH
jgi:hypothetical protein